MNGRQNRTTSSRKIRQVLPSFEGSTRNRPEILDRQLDQRIIPSHASRTRTPQQTDGQVNARVGQLAELRSPRQDQRISRAVQLVAIDRANIGGLSVGKAAFVQQRDTLFLQLGQNAGERLLELLGIDMDQPVDLAQLPRAPGLRPLSYSATRFIVETRTRKNSSRLLL